MASTARSTSATEPAGTRMVRCSSCGKNRYRCDVISTWGMGLTKAYRIHRWKMIAEGLPAVTAIFGKINVAGGAAEADTIPGRVQGVAIDNVVSVLLRQSFA